MSKIGYWGLRRPMPSRARCWCAARSIPVSVWFGAVLAQTTAGSALSPVANSTWPMFRGGPALLGVASCRVPDKLGLLWNFKTGGPVKSSAAIAQGRVFIGSNDGNVYALNFADGKKVWAFKTGGAVESSPLFLDGKVFVGSNDAWLYSLDADSGKLLWKYETGDKILGAPNWVKSPLTPTLSPSDGERGTNSARVLVGSYDFKLHCMDAASGKAVWTYESGNYINGSPAVADGQTAFGGCDALLHVISLANGQQV